MRRKLRVRPRWVRVRERHHLRRLRAQELRVRAVSMPVRFVRVPIEKLIEWGRIFLSRFVRVDRRSFVLRRRETARGSANVRSVP